MGTTSDKLTYLNETKSQLKDMINYGGGNITNETTFRNYVKALFNAFIESLNNPFTLWSNLPHITGTGTEITLNDTIKAPMKVDLKGDTQQDSYTGKNLVGTTNVSSTTTNGITYSITGDTITINGTATANTTIMTTTNFAFSQNTTYTLSFTTVSGSKDNTYMGLRFRRNGSQIAFIQTNTPGSKSLDLTNIDDVQFYILNGTVFTNYSFRFQLETGSSATSYEPYVGGTASPNPNYPQDIHTVSGDNTIDICGKNLANPNNIYLGKSINGNDGTLFDLNTRAVLYQIQVKPNTSYNANLSSNYYIGNMVYYKKDKSFLETQSSSWASTKSLTTPSNAYYVSFAMKRTDDGAMTQSDLGALHLQLELGTATTYEPYKGNSYEVNLGVENLLETKIATETKNGITITHNEDGSYTLNGTATAGTAFSGTKFNLSLQQGSYTLGSSQTLPNGFYYSIVQGGTYIFYTHNNQDTDTKTLTDATTYQQVNEYIWVASGLTLDNFVIKPQLEKGSKANSYSEYGTTPIELCKIGTYQDYIRKSTGKNLINEIITNSRAWTSGEIQSSNGYSRTDYIEVKPSTSYYIQHTMGDNVAFVGWWYDTNKTPISNISLSGDYDISNSITSPNNAKYVIINFYNTTIATNPPMLNEGTTALPYEPYGKVWYLHKEIGKVVLDGTNIPFTIKSSSTSNDIWVTNNIFEINDYASGYSNHFKVYTSSLYGVNEIGIYIEDKRIRCGFGANSSMTSLEIANQFLQDNNVELLYPLKVATNTEITDTNIIKELDRIYSETGQTNITQENNDLPFELNAIALEDLN